MVTAYYDEDGYCTTCGNGHWKHHMPECVIADLLDAIWNDGDPWVFDGGDPPDRYCFFCHGDHTIWRDLHPAAEHKADCVWLAEWESRDGVGPEYGPPVPPMPHEPGSVGAVLQGIYQDQYKQILRDQVAWGRSLATEFEKERFEGKRADFMFYDDFPTRDDEEQS